MADMDELVRKRGTVKSSLTRLQRQPDVATSDADGISRLRVRLQKIDAIVREFNEVQDQIDILCLADKDKMKEQDKERDEFEEKIELLQAKLQLLLNPKFGTRPPVDPVASGGTPSHPSQPTSSGVMIKLPDIPLAKFGGNYGEWTTFQDVFTVQIHDRPDLKAVQKLQYLKSCLHGEAAKTLQAFQISEANYTEAWTLLRERYQNARRIISSHFKTILDTTQLQHEDAKKLRQLLDTFLENIKALEVLKADTWNNIMVYLLTERMDSESRRAWELAQKDQKFPTFDAIKEFLQQRCQALELSASKREPPSRKIGTHAVFQEKPVSSRSSFKCNLCSEPHYLSNCQSFLSMTVSQRQATVRRLQLCFNCLSKNHNVSNCSSSYNCRKCNKRHHSLLHEDTGNLQSHVTSVIPSAHHVQGQNRVLLPTVSLYVGQKIPCRALYDGGSQANFISERLAKQLTNPVTGDGIPVSGIGAQLTLKTKGSITFTIHSSQTNFYRRITAHVLPNLTSHLPSEKIDTSKFRDTAWSNLVLADPKFMLPGPVDILLGADIVFRTTIGSPSCRLVGGPSFIKTSFGWIAGGSLPLPSTPNELNVYFTNIQLSEQLKSFWQLEETCSKSHLSEEEIQAESHYVANTRREKDGRYVVRLPIKSDDANLGRSYEQAFNRLKTQERRMRNDRDYQSSYQEFMSEYRSLKHMQESTATQASTSSYYLPHHAVIKGESTTTKLRVVFDASAKTTNGRSLNDIMLVGPVVQPTLHSILLRFRQHRVPLVADISKMYRQISLHPLDWDYQQILWRDDPGEPPKVYNLTTVAYGTAAAPFLATRTLLQLSRDEAHRYPLACQTLAEDFYVDDVLTGSDTPAGAQELRRQLQDLLQRGGFELRKWASTDPTVLGEVDESIPLFHQRDDVLRTLGIRWRVSSDSFNFEATNIQLSSITKRSILSSVARLFDPLGLVSPIVVKAKLLVQQLWMEGHDWDQPVPQDVEAGWNAFQEDLQFISQIHIPRFVGNIHTSVSQLHGFCDASQRAYGAAVYLRIRQEDGTWSSNLITSKSRVAPIKPVCLPRLELCGAVLLAQLIHEIQQEVKVGCEDILCWTDSTITLSWIKSLPQKWKTFVANRVSEIQDFVPPSQWHHVSGKENPSDLVSRGTSVLQLKENDLWWHGPPWLNHDIVFTSSPTDQAALAEIKSFTITMVKPPSPNLWLTRFSSWTLLVRVVARMKRFVFNRRNAEQKSGPLKASELQQAEIAIFIICQKETFLETLTLLQNAMLPLKGGPLQGVNPWIDDAGLLRVGGRLRRARFEDIDKQPIILHPSHHVTKMIIRYYHERYLHAQATLLLASLRQRFWIIRCRDATRQCIHRCVKCVRIRGQTQRQLMSDLHPARLQLGIRPFIKVGLDYAGPITLNLRKGRGRPISTKAYIALFICLATRAIHLELVSELTSRACVAAIRRFVSRRGIPTSIHSDCGTNFIGAKKEIRSCMDANANEAAKLGIEWSFNPPGAPHFGGSWEAGVKSMKVHMRRTIGTALLTYEEMNTVLVQIEACLNSRPLCPLPPVDDNYSALTPGHFIVGAPLLAIPDGAITESTPLHHLDRWQLLQQRVQHFWTRWKTEYISSLQQRPKKWRSAQPNLQINDVVLIKDEQTPPLHWPLAKVIQLHPGGDNKVRAVTLRTASGNLQRPIHKLCKLPVY